MKKYKGLTYLFAALAVLLSNVMCAAAAYNYAALQWCGQYGGCSAPPDTAFLLCIPYGAGIAICVSLVCFFHKRHQKSL